MDENYRQKGSFAEALAEEYLVQKGYTIKTRNFHFGRYGEIDIIAKEGTTLVFVEVKARWTKRFGSAEESITSKKIMSLRRVAEGYLYINKIENTECRFDTIAIDGSINPPFINHIENAF